MILLNPNIKKPCAQQPRWRAIDELPKQTFSSLPVTATSAADIKRIPTDAAFNSWLGGLIDGDGHFELREGKYPRCKIAAHEDEVGMLYDIQARFGGAVRRYSVRDGKTVRAFQWVLGERAGMYQLLLALNGKLFLTPKYAQFCAVCAIFGIKPQQYTLCRSTGWLAGFFDADGHVGIQRAHGNAYVSITQKGSEIEAITSVWGGRVRLAWGNRDFHVWRAGRSDESLEPVVTYLLVHSRNPQKLKQLAVLRQLLTLKDAKPVNQKAVRDLLDAFWAEKDRKRE